MFIRTQKHYLYIEHLFFQTEFLDTIFSTFGDVFDISDWMIWALPGKRYVIHPDYVYSQGKYTYNTIFHKSRLQTCISKTIKNIR